MVACALESQHSGGERQGGDAGILGCMDVRASLGNTTLTDQKQSRCWATVEFLPLPLAALTSSFLPHFPPRPADITALALTVWCGWWSFKALPSLQFFTYLMLFLASSAVSLTDWDLKFRPRWHRDGSCDRLMAELSLCWLEKLVPGP